MRRKLTIEYDIDDDGIRHDTLRYTIYYRPPTPEERELYNRAMILMLANQSSQNNSISRAESIQSIRKTVCGIGKEMIYRIEASEGNALPEWATDCREPKDVIERYFSDVLENIAMEFLQKKLDGKAGDEAEKIRVAKQFFAGQNDNNNNIIHTREGKQQKLYEQVDDEPPLVVRGDTAYEQQQNRRRANSELAKN